jgi:hypothetical protein
MLIQNTNPMVVAPDQEKVRQAVHAGGLSRNAAGRAASDRDRGRGGEARPHR